MKQKPKASRPKQNQKPKQTPVTATVQRRAAVAKKPVKPKSKVIQSPLEALSDKDRIFVLEYLSSFNATKAAIAAGHKPESATTLGWRLLRKVDICNALKYEQEKRAEALRADQMRILEEEAVIAFFDPQDTCDPATGELKPPHQLPEHIRRNLQGVEMDKIVRSYTCGDGETETETTYKYKYRFGDKGRALERFAKHLGLFTEKVEFAGLQNAVLEILGELEPEARVKFLERLKSA